MFVVVAAAADPFAAAENQMGEEVLGVHITHQGPSPPQAVVDCLCIETTDCVTPEEEEQATCEMRRADGGVRIRVVGTLMTRGCVVESAAFRPAQCCC